MIKRVLGIAVVALMLFGVLGLAACEKQPGFKIGFDYVRGEERGSLLAVGARSDKTEFDLDDFTFEISFGWYNYSLYDTPQEKFALYYFRTIDYNYVTGQLTYDLSYDVGKAHLIKEISAEEFMTQQFEFQTSKKRGKEFIHNEALTISKDIFPGYILNGHDELMIMLVEISNIDGTLHVTSMPSIQIPFQFIDENSIKIKI